MAGLQNVCCRRMEKMDFYKRVGIAVRAVPEGKVATYGQIALLCGQPGISDRRSVL